MKKVLIITQYSLPDHKRNMNAYQRVFYGADYAQIHLLIRRNQSVSREIEERVSLHRAPCENRWLFLVYAVILAVFLRFQGCRIILTEPSGFAAVGFFAKLFAGYFWVMDVWDRPRWRTGFHEEGSQKRFSDRLIFAIMGFADLYLLSVLPIAAKDINPNPEKCFQLYNAIDLTAMAIHPPLRPADDLTLHLAYGKSEFHETLGLQVVLDAAEKLKAMNCPAVIHLVGELPEESESRLKASKGAALFQMHGFIPETRAEFFRKIHVGLVPYLAYEDLSYIFPIKVLEHLSQGNPVIASRVPGLCSMITHEVNGLVVDPGDADQLAEAIHRLQKDRQLWEKLAWNALKSAAKYDAAKKNQNIFQELFRRENNDK